MASTVAVKLALAPVTPGVVGRGDGAGAGRRGGGEGVGAGGVGPAGAGDRAVVVGGDARVGVGRAGGGDGEAAGRAALEVDDRAGAGVVRVGQRGEARTSVGADGAVVSTLTVVVIDGGVADVVGAGQREQVAVAAGDGLRASCRRSWPGRRRRCRRCRRACRSASSASSWRVRSRAFGVVGAGVDRQRRAGVEVAGACRRRWPRCCWPRRRRPPAPSRRPGR